MLDDNLQTVGHAMSHDATTFVSVISKCRLKHCNMEVTRGVKSMLDRSTSKDVQPLIRRRLKGGKEIVWKMSTTSHVSRTMEGNLFISPFRR